MVARYLILAVFLLGALYYDAKSSRIPNNLNVAALIIGLLLNYILMGIPGLMFSLQGLGTGFALLMALYLLGGVGAGDVKLFSAIGALTGPWYTLTVAMYSLLAAALIGIVLMFYRGEFIKRIKRVWAWLVLLFTLGKIRILAGIKEGDAFRFPFMYAVIPGAILAYIAPLVL